MYLEGINAKLNSTESGYADVTHLVPEEMLLSDNEFFNFIYRSNNLIAESQTEAMLEMLQLKSDHVVEEPDQSLIETCLEQWNVIPKTETVFDCTFGQWAKIVYSPENMLSPQLPLCESFNLPGDKLGNDWHCIRIENVGNDNRTFFSTKNSAEVKMFDPISSEWIDVPDIGLEFPTNTFLYGEIVNHHVQRSDTASSPGFHIIDGLVLNGQDIRSYPFLMRLDLCKKFADAINNPSRFVKTGNGENVRSAAVNCKETFPLKDLIPEMEKFRGSWKTTHSGSKVLGYNVQTVIGPKRFYAVNGLLFLRNFPKINDETNFNETFQCRQLWNWCRPDILKTVDIEKTPDDGNLYLSHFCDYMNRRIEQDSENENWRNKNRQPIPSRYSSNRGGAVFGRDRGRGGIRDGSRGRGGGRGRGGARGKSAGGFKRDAVVP